MVFWALDMAEALFQCKAMDCFHPVFKNAKYICNHIGKWPILDIFVSYYLII